MGGLGFGLFFLVKTGAKFVLAHKLISGAVFLGGITSFGVIFHKLTDGQSLTVGGLYNFTFFVAMSMDFLDAIVRENELIAFLIKVALRIGLLLSFVSFISCLIITVQKQENKFALLIVKMILVLFLLANYTPLYMGFVQTVDYVTMAIFVNSNLPDDFYQKMLEADEDFAESYVEEMEKGEVDVEIKDPVVSRLISSMGEKLSKLELNRLIETVLSTISFVMIYAILLARDMLLALLYLTGPFAILSFLNETSSKMFFGWLKSFINLTLIPFVVMILITLVNFAFRELRMGSEILGVTNSLNSDLTFYSLIFIVLLSKSMQFLPSLEKGNFGVLSPTELIIGVFVTSAKRIKDAAMMLSFGTKNGALAISKLTGGNKNKGGSGKGNPESLNTKSDDKAEKVGSNTK